MRIINQNLTESWADVSLKRTYLSGSCQFWTRGGAAFQVRQKGKTEVATILADEKDELLDLKSIDGVVFQAKTVSGTDVLEMLVFGNYYANPIFPAPSGDWLTDSNGAYLTDNNDDFLYS
jgi:hypothetical protein